MEKILLKPYFFFLSFFNYVFLLFYFREANQDLAVLFFILRGFARSGNNLETLVFNCQYHTYTCALSFADT